METLNTNQLNNYTHAVLSGSGVLGRRYKAIRISMKDMIMGTFFQPGFLAKYIPEVSFDSAFC